MGLEFKSDISPTEKKMPVRAGGVMFKSEVGPEVKEEKLYTPIPERVIEHRRPDETWGEWLARTGKTPGLQTDLIRQEAKETAEQLEQTIEKKEKELKGGILGFLGKILSKKAQLEIGIGIPFEKPTKHAEISNLKTAAKNYRDLSESFKENPLLLNPFVDFGKGVLSAISQPEKLVPFAGDIFYFNEMIQTISAAKKQGEGKEITNYEKSLIIKYQAENIPLSRGIGFQVGEMITKMPTYIAEFLTGKVLLAKPIEAAIKKGTTSTIKKAFAMAMGLAAQAGVYGVIKMPTGTAEKAIPYQKELQSPIVQKYYEDIGGEFNFTKAMLQSFGTNAIEMITEYAGGLIDRPMRFLSRAVLGKYVAKQGLSTFAKARKLVNWDGIIGEVFEEELAEFLQAPIEERKFKAPWTPEGMERLFVETLGIAIFQGIAQVPMAVIDRKRGLKKPTLPPVEERPPGIEPEPIPAAEKPALKFKEEVEPTPIEKPAPAIKPMEGEQRIFYKFSERGTMDKHMAQLFKLGLSVDDVKSEEIKQTETQEKGWDLILPANLELKYDKAGDIIAVKEIEKPIEPVEPIEVEPIKPIKPIALTFTAEVKKELQDLVNRDKSFAKWWRAIDKTAYTGQDIDKIYNTFLEEKEKLAIEKREAKRAKIIKEPKEVEKAPEVVEKEIKSIEDIVEREKIKLYPTLEAAKKKATKEGQISAFDQPLTQLDYVIYKLFKGEDIPSDLNWLVVEQWKQGVLTEVKKGQGTKTDMTGMFLGVEGEDIHYYKLVSMEEETQAEFEETLKEFHHIDEVAKIKDLTTLQDGWGIDVGDLEKGTIIQSKDIPRVKIITKGKRKGEVREINGYGVIEDAFDDGKAIVFTDRGFQIITYESIESLPEKLSLDDLTEANLLTQKREGGAIVPTEKPKETPAGIPITYKKLKEAPKEEAPLTEKEMRITPPGQLTVPEIVKVGDIIKTNYDTGPDRVEQVSGPHKSSYDFAEGEEEITSPWYSLVLSEPDAKRTKAGELPKNYSYSYINELVAVDGRLLKLFVANKDEVIIVEKGKPGIEVKRPTLFEAKKEVVKEAVKEKPKPKGKQTKIFETRAKLGKFLADNNAIIKKEAKISVLPDDRVKLTFYWKPAPKPRVKKAPGEVIGDEIDDILAGRRLVQLPVFYDTKTDWLESLGKKWFNKIMRGVREHETPDEIATSLGITEDELKNKIVQRIENNEKRIANNQEKSLSKTHPYIQIAKDYGLEWDQLSAAEKESIKSWEKQDQAKRGLFPVDIAEAKQRDIFGKEAEIETRKEQRVLGLAPEKKALTKPYKKPMTSKEIKAAEAKRLAAKIRGQRAITEEARFPMRKPKRPPAFEQYVKDIEQEKLTSEDVESPTREFETSLNLKLKPEMAFDKLVEIGRSLGITIRISETGWAKGRFSVSRDGKVIRGVALKEFDDPITLSHEIGHAIDFVLIGKKSYFLELGDRIDLDAANWPSETDLIAELKKVSDYVRPFDRKQVSRGYLSYRNKRREMFADYITLYLNEHDQARVLAPRFTEGIEAAHPKILKIKEDFELPPDDTYSHDLPAKKVRFGLNSMIDMFKKTPPPPGVRVFEEDRSKINKSGQRMMNLLGAPFWRGLSHPQFGKIYRAVQDESFYNLSGQLAKQIESADLGTLHKLPEASKKNVAKAIFTGNDKGIQTYFTEEELKSMFGMTETEITAYQKLIKTIKRATNDLIEARKYKYGFYNLSAKRQAELEPIIKGQIEKLGGYFPIDRFGDWAVYGQVEDEPFFALQDKRDDALKIAGRLKRMGYEKVSVYPVTKLPSEFYQNLKKFSWLDLENVAEAAGVDAETPDIKKLKEYLQTKVWDRRLIHRKYVPGYERSYSNMTKTLSSFIESSARKLYKAKATHRSYLALKGIDPRKEPETYALAKNYINDFFYTKPAEFYTIRKGIYLYYLMFKTSFFVQNLTQPLLTTMPEIANYVGGIKAPFYWSLAYKDSAKYLIGRRRKRDPRLDPMTIKLIDRAFKERVIGGMFTEQLMGIIHPNKQRFDNIVGSFGIASETLNRIHSAMAAIRIAKKKGITTEEEVYSFVKQFIEKTQFPYGNQNIPRAIAGAGKLKGIAKTMIVFKMFQLNYLHFLSQRIMRGSKFIGPKAWGVGMMTIIAGVIGLPFASIIYWLLKKLTGFDFIAWTRKKLGTGKAWLSDLVLHGVPTLWNMNLTYLIGLGDIISPNFDPMGQVLGAGYGILDRMSYGYDLLKQGKTGQALTQFSPAFIRNILTAIRWKNQGIEFKKDVFVKPSGWEIFQKGLGFTPNRISKQYEIRDIEAHLYKQYRTTRDQYIKYYKSDDRKPETKEKLLQKIKEWNVYVEDLIWVLYSFEVSGIEVRSKTVKSIYKKYHVSSADKKRWRKEAIEERKREE